MSLVTSAFDRRTHLRVVSRLCRLPRMPKMSLQTQAILAALLEDVTEPHYGLEMAKAAELPSGTITLRWLALSVKAGWKANERILMLR